MATVVKFRPASLQELPRSSLRPGPWQPRRLFNAEQLEELAGSLRAEGVLTPLRVVAAQDSTYLIVAGERRWRAAALAGIDCLPCVVMDSDEAEGKFYELALLDNLHRADLRPGEEALAVARLEQLGMTHRDIAERLGKSPTWVSHRIAIARLPDRAIQRLDEGTITREEARALARLADHPDLIEACLEPDNRRLRARLGGHVPDGVGERLQAIRRVLELECRRDAWADKMRAAGHRVLDAPPASDSRRFSRLVQGSDLSRAHQDASLTCEVWAWEEGQPTRYCNDPRALRRALTGYRGTDPAERARLQEYDRIQRRAQARDAVIGTWLATTSGLDQRALAALAHERCHALALDHQHLARLGAWLGVEGDSDVRASAAQRELAAAGDGRVLQLWFLLEIAQALSYSPVPGWLQPWLDDLGYIEPS